ncbi:MAG: hypothetical protein Q7V19_15340, partial [Bacteroidales bacterium]|nr:hypothetical protein [Bacteroidales bacterium]
YEDSRLEIKYPEFSSLMREYRDGILLFDLMDQRVWSKAVKDTTGLKNFHEANKDNYMWKERADATVYAITNKDELSRVKNIIERLSDDKEIREALEKDSLRAVRIQPGKFELGDNKYVDATKWSIGLSEVMYAEADKFDVIVRIREILPAQTKALDESRGIITSDYQNYLEKEWINILRAKYPVNVDQKVYEQLKASY